MRDTAEHIVPLVIESSFAMTVAISNLFVIFLMVVGYRKLLKNNFYIILANLIFFTSLKAFIECAFVVPYYVMKREDTGKKIGYFYFWYEYLIFNLSVFADYGVLFCSVLIALNRYVTIVRKTDTFKARNPRLKTIVSCALVWLCASMIPLLFYFCDCQFAFDVLAKMYYNECAITSVFLRYLQKCLVYLSYAVAVAVIIIYIRIYLVYHKERHNPMNLSKSSVREDIVQLNLLKQSAVIFALYASSIMCVLVLSFVETSVFGFSQIAFAENLLNLSIAGIYPICFLTMSSELRSVLITKITPRPPTRVASISLHTTPNGAKNHDDVFDLQ